MPEQHADNDLQFVSDAISPSDLRVRSMQGREAISQLYEFEILVETTFGEALDFDQIDTMISDGAYVAFGDRHEHKIHGVLREVEMVSMAEPSPVVYRLKLVPRLWFSTLTFQTCVYLDQSIVEIATTIFKKYGLEQGEDFEFRLTNKYAKHEFIMQYQETDYAFVCRLFERDGIYFFWEHGDEKDKLVVADVNEAFQPAAGSAQIAYDPRQGMTDRTEVVFSLARTRRVRPADQIVRDYNDRTPLLAISGHASVDPQGHGHQVHFGDHSVDVKDAKRHAGIRAEALLVDRETYVGASRVRSLRAGVTFTLESHLLPAMDQEYLVVSVTHTQSQEGHSGEARTAGGYRNEFVAIPSSVAYRAPRVTPWPRIAGYMVAKVDGEDKGSAAALDVHGRYKVTLPIDVSGGETAKASHWVRMAQPFSGQGYGMHFPLHPGVEVALIFLDGDPDRPVIAGSVPNPETGSPVTSEHPSLSRTQTRSGIVMGFHDDR